MVSPLPALLRCGEIAAWQEVPGLVKTRYKAAADVQRALGKVLKHLPPLMPGYGTVFWHPENRTVWFVSGDSDTEQDVQKWHNALKALPGVLNVKSEAEHGPYNDPDWVRIKRAADLSWLNTPYAMAGRFTGGPSPMSNALVSGLLGAGAGYTAGAVLENALPEEYVARGQLRRHLGLAGGLAGGALHIPQAIANAEINQKATGQPHWLRSILQGDAAQQLSPAEFDWRNHRIGGQAKRAAVITDELFNSLSNLPLDNALFLRAAAGFAKEAGLGDSGAMGTDSVPLRPVPVDAFNNAIWNDVHNGMNSSQANIYGTRNPRGDGGDALHTPPVNAAAAAGLVSGIQQMYGNPPLLSPRHFISGLANAGLDMATARVAGGVLGALGGLTPKAQQQLQQMGLWSGMIRGVTGSVLGLR